MMNWSKPLTFLTLTFLLVVGVVSTPVLAVGMSEDEVIDLLMNRPTAFIFDLRWQEKYEEGHLHGAYLIDSSLPGDEIKARALEVIGDTTPAEVYALVYCNCFYGGYARSLADYLITQGYNNSFHLTTTFAYWWTDGFLTYGPEVGSMEVYINSLKGETSTSENPNVATESQITTTSIQFFFPLLIFGLVVLVVGRKAKK